MLSSFTYLKLANRDEGHPVKFAWDDIGPSSPHWFDRTEENSYSWLEYRLALSPIYHHQYCIYPQYYHSFNHHIVITIINTKKKKKIF